MQLPDARNLRLFILVALLTGYVALFGYGAVTGNTTASAVADLYVAAIVLVAVGGRVWLDGLGEGTHLLETAAFLVAAVAIGYAGLAELDVVPAVGPMDVVGNLAILAALLLLLQRRRSEPKTAT